MPIFEADETFSDCFQRHEMILDDYRTRIEEVEDLITARLRERGILRKDEFVVLDMRIA